MHRIQGGEIQVLRPAGGVTAALDPILRACGGTWVAHGAGNADRRTADDRGRLRVPPEDPRYTLRRVWLTKAQEEGYYYGLANSGLWPLCHVTFTRPTFDDRHWEAYREVNALFADAVIEEAGDRPALVFIQDYHFGLLPRMLKERNPNLIVAQFWHIPWPNREIMRAFPWQEELLDGLLGNDLLGFQLRYHCQNFLDTVDRALEARVDMEQLRRHARRTPDAGPPVPDLDRLRGPRGPGPRPRGGRGRCRAGSTSWPGARGCCWAWGSSGSTTPRGSPSGSWPSIGSSNATPSTASGSPSSRSPCRAGGTSRPTSSSTRRWTASSSAINWRWGTDTWAPIVYRKEHFGPVDMMALHRLAHFGVVSSLHDGMNLVAKEFVASRTDEDGVLVLSQFTGSARELTDALLVNPFAIDEIAEAMRCALEMPPEERQRRMRRMRAAVASNNVYRWAGKILSALLRIEIPEGS